jgi:hypothetical protein
MVYVYYHIYATEGVEELVTEQLALIQKHFTFEYKLNIGVSVSIDTITNEQYNIEPLLNILPVKPRKCKVNGQEFMTMYMIKEDATIFEDDDFIFTLHTKGITSSKLYPHQRENIISWRKIMEYFNIERVDYAFHILNNTNHNTYGCLYVSYLYNDFPHRFYAGNFWWGKGSYIKTLRMDGIKEEDRMDAEVRVIQSGDNWKPFSPYNKNVYSHYTLYFDPNEYRNLHLKYSFI